MINAGLSGYPNHTAVDGLPEQILLRTISKNVVLSCLAKTSRMEPASRQAGASIPTVVLRRSYQVVLPEVRVIPDREGRPE